jgi:hypothetical protein
MEGLYARCVGLHVHKDAMTARLWRVCTSRMDETRSYAPTTGALMSCKRGQVHGA